MCSRLPCSNVKKMSKIRLYRGLSIQLLMVLIADLGGILLTTLPHGYALL